MLDFKQGLAVRLAAKGDSHQLYKDLEVILNPLIWGSSQPGAVYKSCVDVFMCHFFYFTCII